MQAYAESSRGEPTKMAGIDLEHLRAYYEAHYTPENSWITFYGSDDVEARLQFIDKFFRYAEWSEKTNGKEVHLELHTAFKEAKYAEYSFASSASTLTDIVLVAWGLNPCVSSPSSCFDLDGCTRTAFHVLPHLLMGNTTSPLYRALADSGISTCPIVRFDLKHPVFGIKLKGVQHREEAAKEAAAVVLQTLSALSASGFPAAEFDSA
ncbi:hypothetical protein Efla_000452 [Eimeria flavescens]